MRLIILIPFIPFLFACKDKKSENATRTVLEKTPIPYMPPVDSILLFSYAKDFKHPNIVNSSDRQVDLLLNGVQDYLGGNQIPEIRFRTDYIVALSFEEVKGGLLVGKQLFLDTTGIKYYRNKQSITGKVIHLTANSTNVENIINKFRFNGGSGSLNYQGQSCMDAGFNRIKLSYTSGDLIIDSLINADVFEYDLDKNGELEQYIFGTRNCSQEIVILRATKKRD
jgi:hypothetical protein